MSRIIIFDYEVFRYDNLLGCIILENGTRRVYQEWNNLKIKNFFKENQNALWVGHNNYYYDDHITEAIVFEKNPYEISQKLVNDEGYFKLKLKFPSIDLMKLKEGKNNDYKLKLTELLCGKNIHETEIDFNLPRALTEEEKKQVEGYNYDDLEQTEYNFNKMQDLVKLRLGIIRKFNLDLLENIRLPMTQMASKILFSEPKPSLKYAKRPVVMYDNLIISNQEVKDFYLQEKYKNDKEELTFTLCGTEVKISGDGALHCAIKKYFSNKVLYADVSGFYNLIAILYDLLPRTMTEEGKKRYIDMYYEQLELKKTNPVQREQYKTVLLAVIGSMKLEGSPFYDPETYTLLTMTGKLFMIDLAEKLEGYVKLVQANTDGLMLEPYNWEDEDKIKGIIKEWSERTGFSIKLEHLYRLWQRDVNCYVCADEGQNIIPKGDAFKNYDIGDKAYAQQAFFKCKEPPIIAQGIVNFLMYNIRPEVFVDKNKTNLKLFQYFCTKQGADYLTYDTTDLCTMERSTELLQGVNRIFALKSNQILGTVYKHKGTKFGKQNISKYSSLPDNVFVYNYALDSVSLDFYDKIDYQYYIERIYQKIKEFI